MYKVIGTRMSRTFRVLWLLEELGQPYEHVVALPGSKDILRYTPDGKIPAMLDGDTALTDSVAIMTYLADKHRAFTHTAGTLERAIQDGVTFRILDELDALLWTAARHSFVLPQEHRVADVKPSLRWEFDRAQPKFAALIGELGLVAGPEFTIADILLTHCLDWAIAAKFKVTDQDLRDFLDRMRARPAYQSAKENQ